MLRGLNQERLNVSLLFRTSRFGVENNQETPQTLEFGCSERKVAVASKTSFLYKETKFRRTWQSSSEREMKKYKLVHKKEQHEAVSLRVLIIYSW